MHTKNLTHALSQKIRTFTHDVATNDKHPVRTALVGAPQAQAASRYWVGSAGGNTNDTANWSATSGNACGVGGGASVPGASDIATFNSECTNNATINADFIVAGIDINTGYTGTITQAAGVSIFVGANGYDQAAGTFTAGDMPFATSNGNFILSGGTYTNSTGGLDLDRDFTFSGGTFTNTNATVKFTDGSGSDYTTFTCSGSFGGTVTITKDTGGDFTLASGCSISLGASPSTVMGTGGTGTYINNGTMTIASGTWTLGNNSASLTNNGTITHSGSGWDITASTAATFTNASGGTITYAGTAMSIESSFTQSGTFNLSGITISFVDSNGSDDATLTCSGSLGGTVVITKDAGADFTLASGCSINLGASPTTTMGGSNAGTYVNNGTMVIASGTWTFNNNSNNGFTNNGTITHSGSGWDINSTVTAAIAFVNASGATITYAGTAITIEHGFTQSGTFNLSGITITFDDNSGTDDATLTCSGSLGGTVVITKDSGGDFTLASGCSISLGASPTTDIGTGGGGTYVNNGTMTIPSGTWTIGVRNGVTFTNNGTITHSGSGWDMNHTSSTQDAGGTFVNASGGTITYAGTNITIEGSLNYGGTFDLTGKTITFDSDSSVDDSFLTCGATIPGNITLNKVTTGANFTLSSSCTIGGNFTRTDGPITNPASAYTLTVQGDFSMSTTDAFGDANLTLTMGGGNNQTITQNAGSVAGPFKVDKSANTASLATNFTTSNGTTAEVCTVVEGTFDLNGKTFACDSTFTIEDGGVLELYGNETTTTPVLNSGSTVKYTGDGDSASDTYTLTTLATTYHHLTVNSTDGATDTFNIAATIDINGNFTNTAGTVTASGNAMTVGGNWSNSGTFTHGNNTVTFDGTSQTIAGTTTFYNFTKNEGADDSTDETLTFTAGTTQTIANTWTLNGRDDNDRINLVSSSPGTAWSINPQGTRTLDYIDVTDSTNTNGTVIACTDNCVNGGNNTNWAFASINISGTVYSNEGTTALGSQTVRVAINGTDGTTTTSNASTGAYSFSSVALTPGDVLTLYLEDMSADAVTVTVAPSTSISSVDLYQNYLIARHDNSGSLTNANLSTAAVASETDISSIYSVSAGALTVASGKELFIAASNTFAPGGNVTTPTLDVRGTYTQSSDTLTISSDYQQSSGTFTGGSGTIDLNDANFTLSGGAFTNSSGGMTVERNFTVNGGTFTNTSKTVTFDDTASGDDTTVTCSGTLGGTFVITKVAQGADFTLASGCTIDLGASPTTTLSNSVSTFTNNGTITVPSGTWTLARFGSTNWPLNNNGTITMNGSSWVSNGVSTLTNNSGGTITHNGSSWDINVGNLTNNSGGTITYAGTAITIARNFTQNGTFDLTGKTITFDDDSAGDDTTMACSGTLGGTVVITKNTDGDFINSSGCTISLGASPTTTMENTATANPFTNNGTITIASGTWTVNGVSQTSIPGALLNNGTITHSGNGWVINDTHLTNSSGATITYAGTAMSLERNLTQSGTFDLTGKTITWTDSDVTDDDGAVACSGSLGGTVAFNKDSSGNLMTIGSGCNIALGASPTSVLSNTTTGGLTNNGTITIASGTWTINSSTDTSAPSTVTNAGTITHSGNGWDINDIALTNNSGATITYAGTAITMDRSFTQNGTFDLTSKTITLDGAVNEDDTTLTCGSTIQGNVVVNKTHATGTTTLGSSCTVAGNFTRTDGPIGDPASAFTLTVQGDFSMATTDTFGGANLTLTMGGGNNQSITQNGAGVVAGHFKVDKSANTATLATSFTTSNGSAAVTCNVVEGTFDINGKIFACDSTFTIEDGGTVQLQGAETVTVPTINSGSTVIYNGSGTYSSGLILGDAYHHLRFNGSGAWTLDAALDANGDLTISQGTLDANNSSNFAITVGGSFNNSGGTFTERQGTVTLDGSGSSNTLREGGSFYNLAVSGSGTWDAATVVAVTNNLTLNSGTLDLSGNNLTVGGTFTTGGTLRLLGTETSVASPTNLTSAGTIAYDNSSTVSSFLLGNNYNNLTLQGSGTVSLAANLDTNGNLTVSSGTLDANGNDLTVGGDLSAAGTISNTSGRTVTLDGTTQAFSPGNITIGTLSLIGSSGTVTAGSNFTLATLLNILSGRTLALSSFTVTKSGSITNAGTINENTGKIAGASGTFYIADSNFDIDDTISLGADAVYISLTDEDGNLNGGSADTLSGVVVTCPTDSEAITLTETGNATEVFRNSGLATAAYSGSATNNNGTLTCANGVTITATYTDPQDNADTQNDTSTATTDTIPTAPSSFAGTAASSTSITWTWTDNANNETGFKLYSSTNVLLATIATANATSYTETGLTASTSYTRKVVAYNAAGNSSYSNTATVSTNADVDPVPTAPSNFEGTAASSTSITWTWTDNASTEDGFKLLEADGTVLATMTTADTESYTETGLERGTTYIRKVVAYNSEGNSTASNTDEVTTLTSRPEAFSLRSPADGAVLNDTLPTFAWNKAQDDDDGIDYYTLVIGSLTLTIPADSSDNISNPVSRTHHESSYMAQYFNENDGNADNDYITVTLKDNNSAALPLPDATYTWAVTATDKGENTRTSASRTLTIDATTPTISAPTFLSTSTLRAGTYLLGSTRPTVQFAVADTRALQEAVVTLAQAQSVLGVTTAYKAIQSTTTGLTGKSATLAFTPREALVVDTGYQLTVTVTDQAGNARVTKITFKALPPAELADLAVAELDAESTPLEEITETLRETLPEQALNLPDLTASAVLRRQKEAAHLTALLQRLRDSRLVAWLFDQLGGAERSLLALQHWMNDWFNRGVQLALQSWNTLQQQTSAFIARLGQQTLLAFSNATRWVQERYIGGSQYLANAIRVSSQYVEDGLHRVGSINLLALLPTPPEPDVTSPLPQPLPAPTTSPLAPSRLSGIGNNVLSQLTPPLLAVNNALSTLQTVNLQVPAEQLAESIEVEVVGSASGTTVASSMANMLGRLQDQFQTRRQAIASLWQQGTNTRVRMGLKNRQALSEVIEQALEPTKQFARTAILLAQYNYEVLFDKEPTQIRNVRISSLSPTTATIEWETTHLTRTGKINYGTTQSYGNEAILETKLSRYHRADLTDLEPNQTYYFEVMNQNSGYVYDAYYTLTTPATDTITATLLPQDAIIEHDTTVRLEPHPDADVLTTLYEGERVRTLTEQGDWISVLLPGPRQGWLQKADVQLVPHDGVSPDDELPEEVEGE